MYDCDAECNNHDKMHYFKCWRVVFHWLIHARIMLCYTCIHQFDKLRLFDISNKQSHILNKKLTAIYHQYFVCNLLCSIYYFSFERQISTM